MKRPARKKESGQLSRRGSALILAVWALFLLSSFAVQLGTIVRQKVTIVHRLDNRDKLFYIADAGIKYAIMQLRQPDALMEVDFLSERWSDQEDLFKDRKIGQGRFEVSYTLSDGESSRVMYGLEDEERKLNLNTASVQVMTRLLEKVAGLSHNNAEELAYCIIDWRDSDSFLQHPQFGAEDTDYKSHQFAYEAKDSDYEVIEELLLVSKMNQEIFDRLKHFVTTYGEGKININTASQEVLMALGMDEHVARDILAFRKGGDGIAGTGDDDIFLLPQTITSRLSQAYDLSPSELSVLSNLVAEGQFVTKSENFMIRSTATLANQDGQRVIVAVADRRGRIKYWHDEI